MIKIVYGKPWEGKSLEIVREIENSREGYKIGVFSEDWDFNYILAEFGNREVLKNKDIKVYDNKSTAEDVLSDGHKFDMIVLDLIRDWEDLTDSIRKSDCEFIVITQQLSFHW